MTQPTRKRSGLGRGLASLIPTGPADGEPAEVDVDDKARVAQRVHRKNYSKTTPMRFCLVQTIRQSRTTRSRSVIS